MKIEEFREKIKKTRQAAREMTGLPENAQPGSAAWAHIAGDVVGISADGACQGEWDFWKQIPITGEDGNIFAGCKTNEDALQIIRDTVLSSRNLEEIEANMAGAGLGAVVAQIAGQ